MRTVISLLVTFAATLADSADVVLESFASPVHTWKQQNDPVMGGRSTGTFTEQGDVGVFEGSVVDVPYLKAPGFIKVSSQDSHAYPDITSCSAMKLTLKATSAYAGYRMSFGTKHPPEGKFFASGFKAHFDAPVGEFGSVVIPFTNFSDLWDDGTGDLIKTCQDDAKYCPDEGTLRNVKTISIWGEGVAGKVHLELKEISATGCGEATQSLFKSRAEIVLEDFESPSHTWKQKNDPVMGGKSTGTFTVKGDVGVFDGDVVDVPFLKAPGFIKVSSEGSNPYPDITSCTAMSLTLKASSAYAGYRMSFGTAKAPGGKFFASGYKAHFDAPVGEFGTVTIPFKNFSDYWDDATGDLIKTCQDDSKYCPDEATLKNVKTISIWGEGVAGKVHLEIQKLTATGCGASSVALESRSSYNNTCSGPVQKALRYNMTASSAVQDFPFPVADGETLADAVCCDSLFKPYAEPRGTYARDDVALFSKMNPNGTTTFYDSVCGIPLFTAPRGRTLADFQADTEEHGWPSFRQDELIKGSSHINHETGEVLSKCGTHLGSYLPDEKGARWCLDLVCLSGSPTRATSK
ncbi:hypothetical protein CYMTET_5301 [Cymbomonas tetramitiformis]|uniref:NADH:ubiquinone oxidoreductase intermediate-associated protein 30 domain-containing protein n=1 Tax=Cymbomonas tetramitiformis TaxID=36881 RepID=A0AAE0GZR9_9CHLO|nr:hypothetical protein CYMTET_5301 [Cymbomonas tetramitiformis]|eukprot:gene20823-24958_t